MINRFSLTCGAALATLALGACNKGGAAVAMEQGEWETTMEVTNLDMNNLPPEIRDGMRMPANRTQTERGCWTVSADLIRIQNLRFTIPAPGLRNAGCTMAELTMEGGTLRGRLTCTGIPGPFMDGGRQTMSFSSELDGSYTANSAQATAHGEVRFGDRSGSGSVRITSRRIGACPPPRPYTPPYSPPVLPDDMRAPPATNGAATVPPPDPGQSARDAMNQAAREAQADMAR